MKQETVSKLLKTIGVLTLFFDFWLLISAVTLPTTWFGINSFKISMLSLGFIVLLAITDVVFLPNLYKNKK